MTTFYCPECNARVQLVIEKTYSFGGNESTPECAQARFGHCALCQQPALLRFIETGVDANGFPTAEFDIQLFPAALARINAALPERVEESYIEAMKCAGAQAWLAAAVMVRRTLEAIGQEFDPKARRLFDGLAKMKEQGVISEELWRWGEALRFLGNTGAHPSGDKIQDADAKDAVEFLNAIIQNIYVLRPKFQAMQARRPLSPRTPEKPPADADH
ncbi:MAG: DUF4145 domain-containing protein [Deltaproteobacteria bacterium]|nr:DUF4145 domain-containing protein [Deltaproteobacteria bacterium]